MKNKVEDGCKLWIIWSSYIHYKTISILQHNFSYYKKKKAVRNIFFFSLLIKLMAQKGRRKVSLYEWKRKLCGMGDGEKANLIFIIISWTAVFFSPTKTPNHNSRFYFVYFSSFILIMMMAHWWKKFSSLSLSLRIFFLSLVVLKRKLSVFSLTSVGKVISKSIVSKFQWICADNLCRIKVANFQSFSMASSWRIK